jgi:hypothetical protein
MEIFKVHVVGWSLIITENENNRLRHGLVPLVKGSHFD